MVEDPGGSRWGDPQDTTRDQPVAPGAHEPRVAAGDIVGGYRLQRCVGRGGMGEVWMAVHHQHQRAAAVKIIRREVYAADDRSAVSREFRQIVDLRHDHIVGVSDAGLHPMPAGRALPYIVMEYLPAARPLTRDADERRLDLLPRLRLFAAACSAVAYVHAHGGLHLDIKPDNLLVDESGRVFLTDFGIARPVLGWVSDAVAGTPGFMSPEHLAGDVDRVGKRSDVWSLGAVLFSLLTGKTHADLPPRPSPADWLAAAHRAPRRLDDADPMFATRARGLHPALEAIVARCLDPDPERRYADAGELAVAIDRILSGNGLGRRFARLTVRRPRVAASLVIAAIAGLSTAVSTLFATPVLSAVGVPLGWQARLLPAGPTSLAPLERLPNVALIEFDTATAEAVRASIPGFEPASRMSYRTMHAALIPRLVKAGVRAIGFDVFFSSTEPEIDPPLAAAIRAARRDEVGVVLAVRDWRVAGGRPVALSQTLWDAGAAWGSALSVGWVGQSRYWADVAALRRGQDLPSFATAVFAAYRDPGSFHDFDLRGGELMVRPLRIDEARPRAREPIPLVFDDLRPYQPPKSETDCGLGPGDAEAFCAFDLPSGEAYARSTIRYEEIWQLPDHELRAQLGGKIALVVDAEYDNVIEDTRTRGSLVHAAAIERLIEGETSSMTTSWNVPLVGLGAVIAALVVFALSRVVRRRPLPAGRATAIFAAALLLATAAVSAVAWTAMALFGLWLQPVPAAGAAVIAGLLTIAGWRWTLPPDRRRGTSVP